MGVYDSELADAAQSGSMEQRGRDAQHRKVHRSSNPQRHETVPATVSEERAPFARVVGVHPVLVQRGVEIDHVGHDGCADDPHCEAEGVRAAEVGHHASSELAVVLIAHGE